MLQRALHHHRAGDLSDAERLYRQILAIDRRHTDSLHLLGLVADATGRRRVAIDMIKRAIAINGHVAMYHFSLGTLLGAQLRVSEAIACYRRALALQPDFPDASANLANLLKDQGQLDEAIICYRQALDLQPNRPETLNSLGIALQRKGCANEAIGCFRRAVDLRPDFAAAHNNLGNALADRGNLEDATACFRTALELHPDYAQAYNNLGNTLKELHQLDAAAACLRRAIELKPDYDEACYNYANVLRAQGQLDAAVVAFQRALHIRPNFADAHVNLGNTLAEQRRLDDATTCYRRALAIAPDLPDAHFNLGLVLLARGDLLMGWQEYEWRWKIARMAKLYRDVPQPQWRGEAAAGHTLLIHAEQGFGDTLQFCRYAALAVSRGLKVVLEVPPPLVRLLHSLRGVSLVSAPGDKLPPFDFHCPMLSLPLALGTTLATIPTEVPYLRAESRQIDAWQARLTALLPPGIKVGLVWAGDPRRDCPDLVAVDRRRSIDPVRLAPLFDVRGIHFFSLQKAGPAAPTAFRLIDVMAEMNDFADTAALIANLDLVIAVDTAVAHLAAALGKPVWLLDRFDSCWRWLTDRRDSPWYPTLRIYRQARPGDWDSALTQIVVDLRRLTQT